MKTITFNKLAFQYDPDNHPYTIYCNRKQVAIAFRIGHLWGLRATNAKGLPLNFTTRGYSLPDVLAKLRDWLTVPVLPNVEEPAFQASCAGRERGQTIRGVSIE